MLAWKAPVDYPQELMGSYDVKEGSYESTCKNFNCLSLSKGECFSAEMDIPDIYFKASNRKIQKLDFLWLLGNIPLVGLRVAEFLEKKMPSSIQLISPGSISAAGREVGSSYFILNVVSKVDAIDNNLSDAESDEFGRVLYYNRIFLKQDLAGDYVLAREISSRDLLVSDSLAAEMKRCRFNNEFGLGFYSVNGRYVCCG